METVGGILPSHSFTALSTWLGHYAYTGFSESLKEPVEETLRRRL